MAILSHLTKHRVYGTGISSCLGKTFYADVQAGVTSKSMSQNGMTYIWTIDKESSMRDYINRGVQGLMTNRIALAKKVAISMGLTVAKPSTSIPITKVAVQFRGQHQSEKRANVDINYCGLVRVLS
jgi:hypothetical protein